MKGMAVRFALAVVCAAILPACGDEGDTTIIQQVPAGTAPQSGWLAVLSVVNTIHFVAPSAPGPSLKDLVVTKLIAGETLIGIDYRPADGLLYGLGDTNRIYRIDDTTGAAAPVGTGFTTSIAGNLFGVDFNPVSDRLRIVNDDSDLNLRVDPDSGGIVTTDTPLSYAGGDVNFGVDPQVMACAYTNNVAGALTTTLYGIDTGTNALVIHNPPNNGFLTTVGALTVNPINAQFDISAGGIAYAALHVVGINTNLYTIDLTTGTATLVGTLLGGGITRGLAVVP
jgi:hypothetical protein